MLVASEGKPSVFTHVRFAPLEAEQKKDVIPFSLEVEGRRRRRRGGARPLI